MIRKFVKKMIPYSEEVFVSKIQWLRVVRRVEKKIKNKIIDFVLIILFILVLLFGMYKVLTKPVGYYAADGYDTNRSLIDTDGDGDYYHWVDPEE